MNLNDIAWAQHDHAVSRGWWSGPLAKRIPRLLEWLTEEVDEATEAWENTGRRSYYSTDEEGLQKPEGLPSELADVMLVCMDLGAGLGIDLEAALQEKWAYNKIRKYKRDAEGNHLRVPSDTPESLPAHLPPLVQTLQDVRNSPLLS